MSELGIRVCGDRVLVYVEPAEDEIKLDSGIVIPQTQQKREMSAAAQNVGTLVQLGSMAWHDAPEAWAKIGDKVCFGKYAGTSIYDKKTDKTYKMIADTDINAVYLD